MLKGPIPTDVADADVGSKGGEGVDRECGGSEGELEHLSGLHNRHIDDVTDDHSIYIVCWRWTPGYGG